MTEKENDLLKKENELFKREQELNKKSENQSQNINLTENYKSDNLDFLKEFNGKYPQRKRIWLNGLAKSKRIRT